MQKEASVGGTGYLAIFYVMMLLFVKRYAVKLPAPATCIQMRALTTDNRCFSIQQVFGIG